MNRYQHTYRIPSSRLQNWDYRRDAAYFITICTQNQERLFGEIDNETMILSGVGILADVFWPEIPNHSPNVELGQFVVMPNHIHGILILYGKTISNPSGQNVETLHETSLNQNSNTNVETLHETSPLIPKSPINIPSETLHATSLQPKNTFYSDISPKSNSISTIIRSYKSAVSKHNNRLGLCPKFGWQTRFHDHIIRNEIEFQKINCYIQTNPENWNNDKFYNNLAI